MKVQLINYTSNALETLIYTKNTRLKQAWSFDEIFLMGPEFKEQELAYMRGTIQSSWEFVDYIFDIQGVTRAFTHQLVRSRTGSYAQESQRTVNVASSPVVNTCKDEHFNNFEDAAVQVMAEYGELIDNGCPPEDARGLLPTNISTSIIAKFNLRSLADMAKLRLCYRTQGEYRKVFQAMIDEVFKVHPWAKDFIKVHCAWYGTCAFPSHSGCPIKSYTFDLLDRANFIQSKYDECIK